MAGLVILYVLATKLSSIHGVWDFHLLLNLLKIYSQWPTVLPFIPALEDRLPLRIYYFSEKPDFSFQDSTALSTCVCVCVYISSLKCVVGYRNTPQTGLRCQKIQ